MKNLVSRNPVLRFKEGKKIIKAELGNIVLIDSENDIWQDKSTGKKYLRNWRGRRWNRTPQGTSGNDFGNYFLEYSPSVPQLRIGMNGKPIIDTVSKLNTTNNSTNMNVAKKNTHNWLEGLRNKYVRPFLKTTVIPQLQTQTGKTTLKKGSITPSVFAGHKIGRTGGLNYKIDNTDRLQLIGTGQFKDSDFIDAISAQKALNRYFANSGLGSIKEDNAWGDQSRKALELALSKSKSLTPFNNETTIVKTPIVPTYTPPINLEVANLKLNVNVPQQTYDRTGIREYLRSKGLNPYSFSGALRRALRMVLNNTADDNDKLLVKGMGLFKQGGLISRNPIERFKNGGVLKFQNAGNLPTAPKAEDRYKNGRRIWDAPYYKEVSSASNIFGDAFASKIAMEVNNNNDTTFYETPGRWLPVKFKTRQATKKNQNFRTISLYPGLSTEESKTIIIDPGYETLKRRFNIAWNLTK